MNAWQLFFFVCAIFSCGAEKKGTPASPPQPPPVVIPPPPPSGIDTWATLKPLIDSNCALAGCHASSAFVASESAYLTSQASRRVGNGSMPPRYSPNFAQWNDTIKNRFIAYYESKR